MPNPRARKVLARRHRHRDPVRPARHGVGLGAAPGSLNPTWTKLSYDRAKWYAVSLHLDFTLQRVQYLISTKETASKVTTSAHDPDQVRRQRRDRELTRMNSHRVAYTFNDLVNGYLGTDGTGTHPNLAGITSFRLPALTSALVRADGTGSIL